MSIQYTVPDSNPQTSERESPPITTRPGLPPSVVPRVPRVKVGIL